MMKKLSAPRGRVIGTIVLLAALFCTRTTTSIHAQSASGTILGNVMDPSRAAVPASITARNQDTGIVRNTASSAEGVYNVPSLLPGNYTVEASAPGFGPVQVKDVVVRVGSETRV